MKIGKKLLITNILINVVAMSILATIIINIVSNYIEKDIENDLIKENNSYSNIYCYGGGKNNKNGHMNMLTDEYSQIIFDITQTPRVDSIKSKHIPNMLNIGEILEKNIDTTYSININDKSYIGYNSVATLDDNIQNRTILIATLLPNDLIKYIKSDIIKVLLIAIIVISILSMIITNLTKKMITKPIDTLVDATKEISQRNFDVKVNLKTNDEFEILGQAINNMCDDLKKQDIEQKKFYQNVSHELKTPITVISGYAQGIKSNIFNNQEEYLDIIVEECDGLKKQLEKIIYLSKLDTVNEIYEFKKHSINNLVEKSLQKVESIIIINEIDIEYYPTEQIYIKADEEKIITMFTNILSNCLKYTKDTIYIDINKNNECVNVDIYDNGEGFNEKILENPFSGITIGNKEGTGIGLTIIQKIIKGHNGTIKIENEKNLGGKYTLTFPID